MNEKRIRGVLRTIVICLMMSFTGAANAAPAIRFAVISDLRAGAMNEAMDFIKSAGVNFIIVPGDFYYDQADYYAFFQESSYGVNPDIDPGMQGVYFALGNHDQPPEGEALFRSEIAPAYPQNGPSAAPEGTVFSFDRGNCHFTVTNPYWGDKEGGYNPEQLQWIEQDLAGSDMPFKFVVGHEPAYPLRRHVGDSLDADPAMRDRFWQKLSGGGASVYFCGHTHNLSSLVEDGVYQVDAGEVRGDHLCITLVDVDKDSATIRSYMTGGRAPVMEDGDGLAGDLKYSLVLTPGGRIDFPPGMQVLFGPLGASEGKNAVCFIDSMEKGQ